MAKAKKNALFDKAHEVESELNKNSESLDKNIQVEKSNDSNERPIISLATTKTTVETQEKLEQFEMLIEENRSLNSKIDELTAKITDYIAEVETLRVENKKLDEISKECNILKNDVKTLTEENEDLQIKISELIMENTKLLSEKNTIEQNNVQDVCQTPNVTPTQHYVQNHKQYIRSTFSNGYDSWN